MKTILASMACIFVAFVSGIEVESLYAKKVSSDELQAQREAGYRAGYADEERYIKWFTDNCSSFGSGDIQLIVCKGGAK